MGAAESSEHVLVPIKIEGSAETGDLAVKACNSDLSESRAVTGVIQQIMAKGVTQMNRLDLSNANMTEASIRTVADTIGFTIFPRELVLDSNQMSSNAVRYVAQAAVGETSPLLSISLNDCGVNDDGARLLANVLTSQTKIKTLKLGKNLISDEGCAALAEAIAEGCDLEGLSLMKNAITSDGIEALARTIHEGAAKLTWLGLAGNFLDARGVQSLCDACKHNKHLVWLGLGANQLGDEGCFILADFLQDPDCHLVSLGLGANAVSDLGVQRLCNALLTNKSLEYIGLGNNQITGYGAECVAQMLALNSTLKRIVLSSNTINNYGMQRIAGALSNNSCLEDLLLAMNNFTDHAARDLVTSVARDNKTLRALDIGTDQLSYDIETEIIEIVKSHSTIEYIGLHHHGRVIFNDKAARKQAFEDKQKQVSGAFSRYRDSSGMLVSGKNFEYLDVKEGAEYGDEHSDGYLGDLAEEQSDGYLGDLAEEHSDGYLEDPVHDTSDGYLFQEEQQEQEENLLVASTAAQQNGAENAVNTATVQSQFDESHYGTVNANAMAVNLKAPVGVKSVDHDGHYGTVGDRMLPGQAEPEGYGMSSAGSVTTGAVENPYGITWDQTAYDNTTTYGQIQSGPEADTSLAPIDPTPVSSTAVGPNSVSVDYGEPSYGEEEFGQLNNKRQPAFFDPDWDE